MDRVSKSPAIFDIHKLNWLNGLYIRELAPEELFRQIAPYLADCRMPFAPVQQGRGGGGRSRPTWWC